jgi:hypothetical protein
VACRKRGKRRATTIACERILPPSRVAQMTQNQSLGISGDKSSPNVGRLGNEQLQREQQGSSLTVELNRTKGASTDRNKGVVVVVDTRATNQRMTRTIPTTGYVARSLPPLDSTRLLTVLTRDASLTTDEGFRIVECIQRWYVKSKTQITSFRARHCVRNGKLWPIAEWKEGPNVEITAVFMMEDGNSPLSSLTVRGIGLNSRGSTKRYQETWLEWVTGNTDQLMELILVAQFWLGAVHWDKSKTHGEDYNTKEYCSRLRVLMR